MSSLSRKPGDAVGIVGGGIIGLGIGWRLARRGASVTIIERDTAGQGASRVAAGMLAPIAEVGFEDGDAFELGRESLRLYPQMLDELAEDSGTRVSLDERGTLMVGFNRDHTEHLRRLYRFREQLGLPVEWLGGTDAREFEPLLSPKTAAGMWIPDDCQVESRSLIHALKTAFQARGGTLLEHTEARSVVVKDGRVAGIETEGETHPFPTVVVAAGSWSGEIAGVPAETQPPVRPVKGQILTLRLEDEYELARVVRAPDVYLLPKEDGRLLVGASQEEMGFDTRPTAGPVLKLLEWGFEALPFIYELPLEEIEVGLRPASRDHKPIIGVTDVPGLFYATGHFRHGILLTPVTAYGLADLLLENRKWPVLGPFQPSRFNRVRR